MEFEHYVIAHIKANVDHRTRKRRSGDGHGDESAHVDSVVAIAEGLGLYSTQQLEEELARRKRRRTESPVDAAQNEQLEVTDSALLKDYWPAALDSNSFEDEPLPTPTDDANFGAPPSGGAAARADPQAGVVTSFATACETQCELDAATNTSPWYSATESPSLSPIPPETSCVEDSIPLIATQD